MKLTCFLLFLAVGGSYASRGLDSHTSGDAAATAGRSLLGLNTPCGKTSSTKFLPCSVLPLPGGVSCPSCIHGFQSGTGNQFVNGKQTSCTVYQDCTVASVSAGDPSTTATSSQSGTISASTTQTSTTTGTGSASTSVSATGQLTLNIDGTGFIGSLNTVYNNECPNGLNQADISNLLVAYVQSCANAYIACTTQSKSNGGGATSASCNVAVTAAQTAEVTAMLAAAQSFIQSTCGTASAQVNQAYIDSFIDSSFSAAVWTKVSTNGYGTAKAVSAGDVSDLLSAFSSLCYDLYAKTCSCKPSCLFCKPQSVPNCPGTGCPTTTSPSTGVTVDGNTGNVAIDYSFYKGTITSIFANAWTSAYNKGCGQYTSLSVWADAYAQAVAHIMADFTAYVKTTGSGSASAGYHFDAIGQAVTTMYADFEASATVGGCTGQCTGCVATAATTAADTLQSQGFANFCIDKCNSVSASGWDYDGYHNSFASSFASAPALTSAVQTLDASVGSTCLCGTTPIETIVASNSP